MADSTQGGNNENRTFAPAGAGFNLEQFKNEVASEIGLSLGRQGFGQGAAQGSTNQGAAQGFTNQAAYQSMTNQSAAAQGFSNMNVAGAAQDFAGAAGSLSGLAAGAAGTAAQTDFEVSSTLGEQTSPAAKVAKKQGQNQ